MQEQGIPDEGQQPNENRAEELKDRVGQTARAHQGNRATADTEEPQPTWEPTRDQQ